MGWHGLARSRTRYPLLANAVQRLLTAMVGQDREEANRLQQSAQICGDPAEFWPQRLLAFELRRWGNAARASCCRDLQQALCAEVAIERHRKARIGRGFCRSKDAPPAAKPAIPLRTLRWTLGAKRACVVIKDIEPDRLAPLAPPAPIGLRGVWVVAARSCAPARSRGVLYVQAQTCAGP